MSIPLTCTTLVDVVETICYYLLENSLVEDHVRYEMRIEKDYLYEVETEPSVLNDYNILKPYAYQNLFAQIVEKHLRNINVNVNITRKYNLAWVLTSLSFELVKPVEGCIKMYANTWYSQRRGPFFRRELVFRNENGEVMFHGSTFSVLLDVEKRTIYRKKELPFLLGQPTGDFTIEASPTFKTNLEFCKVDERKVLNSHIDYLGHVNNCRYGEFAYDAFTDKERQNLAKLKRMDFNFTSELRKKDTFSILKAYDGNKVFVRGYNDIKDNTAFDIKFEFSNSL
ncbi:Acyl-ACP thioesterase [Pelotomaculum sp. FP]|uniref:acyl-ACP thioesterase domain-containing protein n=1 Tax=Pelotomaculum sp. FP TaxID=261474 RepID=UPI001065BD36|nr:acyl-ACP thioesterase domain-containing protein [Pelotomaculum sp. FP]TEB15468.1 Acyl-ACP thioesterase [Pelotomaculum sp. FP]